VGRDGLWPIDRHHDDNGHHDDPHTVQVPADLYTVAIDVERLKFSFETLEANPADRLHPGESGSAHALLHVATWMKAAFILLLCGLVIHGFAYLSEIRVAGPSEDSPKGGSWSYLRVSQLAGWARHLPLVHPLSPDDEPARVIEHRLFLLIAFAILWFVSVWAVRLFLVWWQGDAPLPPPANAILMDTSGQDSFASKWHLLYGAVLVLLIYESFISIRHRRTAAPKGWVAGTIVTGFALFLALQAGLSLAGFLESEPWSDEVSARLLLARTVNPENWVSPAAPLLVISSVLYLWAIWNVRQLLMGGWAYRRSSQLIELMTGREPHLRDEIADIMVSPWRRQDWRCLAIPFGLALLFALYVPRWYTPDGLHFDDFIWWGSLLTVFLVAHSLATTVHLWLLIRRILRHLFGHPIASAFSRVAGEPFNWRLSLTPPRAAELKPMARKARDLRLGLRQVLSPVALIGPAALPVPSGDRRRSSPDVRLPVADLAAATEVEVDAVAAGTLGVRRDDVVPMTATLGVEMPDRLDRELREGGDLAYFRSESWTLLIGLSDALVPVLRFGFWHRGRATTSGELDGWYRNAEALVGMQVAFVLRDLLSRLVSGMTVTIAGATLALASHLFYSFPGRSAMLAFDWVLVALAVASAAAMLIRLERDPILTVLWARTPGGAVWTGGFVYRLALYGAVPIVTLFAWQFPEVGSTLFGWMEPLRKAIP
jgi:hypothetical protein